MLYMEITVAELRLLKNAIQTKLHDLINERQDVAYVEYDKGEEPEISVSPLNHVMDELKKVRMHLRVVKRELAKANQKEVIAFDGELLSIQDALELVKQLRNESDALQRFGRSKPVERVSSPYDSTPIYRRACFEPTEFKTYAEETLKEANHLSILIDKANFEQKASIDFVNEYQ